MRIIIKFISIFTILIFSNITLAEGPARVYMIEGFPFKSPFRAAWKFGVDTVKEHTRANYPDAKFKDLHNNDWYSVCKELKELPPEQKPSKLVLIGHSYGAWATVQISLCLKGIMKVDTLVTIDPITKIADDPNAERLHDIRNVPENVKKHYNYYESSDLLLSGVDNMRAINKDCTESTNELIKVGFTLSPHNRIVEILAETSRLQKHVDETFKSL